MQSKWALFIFIALVVGGVMGYYLAYNRYSNIATDINSFEECVAAGNQVMETEPRTCAAAGRVFTEEVTPTRSSEMIEVVAPQPNALVNNPIRVSGRARGNWFFEASFPVYLYDENGNLLAQTTAMAEGDWMTEDYVNFTADLDFDEDEVTNSDRGEIVLARANPSGEDQNAEEVRIPVRFTGANATANPTRTTTPNSTPTSSVTVTPTL